MSAGRASRRGGTSGILVATVLLVVLVLTSACARTGSVAANATVSSTSPGAARPVTTATGASPPTAAAGTSHFKAEIWADNWFSLYVNGTLVGEDSVPITTERSFNAETIAFDASYPLTIAMVTKDFIENDSGLEYIGTPRQQMGDGGFIAQFTDTGTGRVIATTGGDWRGLVVQRAPLDPSCERSINPTKECTSTTRAEPDRWTAESFDDAAWVGATVYTAEAVAPKDGYTTIAWDRSASLIWTSSLEQDNTILWRHSVPAP